MHEHVHEPEPPQRLLEPPTPAPAVPRILALQQSAGNRAVGALLQRQAPPAAPAAGTQAAAEADAVATVGLLRDTHQLMLASADLRIRNTGQMMDAPGGRASGGRVRATPMTIRSDSAQLVAARGDDPTTTAYYFYGTVQNNEHRFGPNTLGTIDGDSTIVIRGKDPTTGNPRAHDEIIRTLVHETSHIIVADYGEHPGTETDAGSFDRYRDEFRAYFIVPVGPYAGLAPDDRADAIRTHLVGTAAGTGGYAPLNAAFWATPHASNTFRAQVLAHRRPDGFNLDNSPYLDRLVHLLSDQHAGRATVEDTLFQITVLSPTERAEAAGATLIASPARPPPGGRCRPHPAVADLARGRQLRPRAEPRREPAGDGVPGGRDHAHARDDHREPTGSAIPTTAATSRPTPTS